MINPTYKKAFFTSAPSAEAYLGDLKSDGTVPLTSDWNVGAFDLTCVDMNATNFKLSGVGTLTSALGNVSLTTALTAASGDEVAFTLTGTVNKAAGSDTIFKVVQTDTASPGTSYLQEWYTGSTQVGYINNAGAFQCDSTATVGSYIMANAKLVLGFSHSGTNARQVYNVDSGSTGPSIIFSNVAATGIFLDKLDVTTSGTNYSFSIKPVYNQASGTAANTDLLINRTETAVGSGQQNLIDGQVGSTSRFRISNKGFETRAYPLACTHDTATALFGIAVTAGNTAGGVITYTLNVTDDDGSDDQIEVGTVQFVGLQDEANWHTNISEVSTQALESGTLATTWAIDTATADTLKVTLLANSNLTTPVYTLSYTVTFNNAYTVTTY